MSRNRLLFALLCTGLLLNLVGPRPASLRRVPPPAASLSAASLPVASSPAASLPAALARPQPPPEARLRPAPAGGFRWPLAGGPRVVRRFDPPARPWLPGHRGVDLAAAPGATVRAAGAGRVRFAGPIAGRSVISVDHAGGLRTTYEPVEPLVRTGDEVSAGQPIGRVATGHAGCTVAACLHWGLRQGDVYLDPLALLGLGQVRLLPLASPS